MPRLAGISIEDHFLAQVDFLKPELMSKES